MKETELVRPYVDILKERAETDSNRVVRIHSLGALKTLST